MVCHVLMFLAILWRTVEPGFSAYRTASCSTHGRALVTDIQDCARAAQWYNLPSKTPVRGENRSRPLTLQPPGCYYSSSEHQIYFNAIICSENEQWCHDWVARTYGSCSKEASCLCQCSFASLAIMMSMVIFALPVPLQWRMFQVSPLPPSLLPLLSPPSLCQSRSVTVCVCALACGDQKECVN
jgi:hypothetical protein